MWRRNKSQRTICDPNTGNWSTFILGEYVQLQRMMCGIALYEALLATHLPMDNTIL